MYRLSLIAAIEQLGRGQEAVVKGWLRAAVGNRGMGAFKLYGPLVQGYLNRRRSGECLP